MKNKVYEIVKDNVGSHWWAVSKDKILLQLINSLDIPFDGNVLELGVGTGSFLSKLGFVHKFGIDSYKYQEPYNSFSFIQADVNRLPLKEHSIDLLLLIDLIEHIENDEELIKNCFKILRRKGKLLIFVPAFPILWSDLDEMGMHFRRYTSKDIENLVIGTGMRHSVIKKTYINFFLFPYILIARIIQRMLKKIFKNYDSSALRRPNKIINNIFRLIFISEPFFLRFMSFPVGVSYVYIVEKN